MKYFIYIFIIIISIINNNNIVKCQLIPTSSNQDIVLNGSQYNNKYSSYGTLNSGYTQCYFEQFYDLISNKSELNILVPSQYFSYSITYNIVRLMLSPPVSSDNITFQFTIRDTDLTISSSYSINVNCEELDGNELEINIFNYKLQPVEYYTYHSSFEIKGLKYQLEDRVSVISSNSKISSDISTNKIINNYYNVFFKINNVQDFIDQPLEISIVFPNKIFNFTLDTIYSSSDYQHINYQIYPSILSTTTFTEYGNGVAPQVIFSTNLTDKQPFYYPFGDSKLSQVFKISQLNIGGILTYYYIFTLFTNLYKISANKTFNYTLSYNNGPSKDTIIIPVYNYQSFPVPFNISGEIMLSTHPINTNTFSFSFSSDELYDGAPILHSYYSFNSLTQFPYGFINGNNQEYNYRACYSTKPSSGSANTKNRFYIYYYPQNSYQSIPYYNPSTNTTLDLSPPEVIMFELVPINGFKYLLRIKLRDESTVVGFSQHDSIGEASLYSYESLISVENDTWLFETPVDLSSIVERMDVIDIYGNSKDYKRNSILFVDSDQIPVYLKPTVPIVEWSIFNITFLNNDIDVLNQPNYNTIYFNSTTIPIDYPLGFLLKDDVSTSLSEGKPYASSFLPISYDDEKKLFYCDFVVPKNTNAGSISYIIGSYYGFYSVGEFISPLRVSKTSFDNEGPIIKSIVNANSFGKVGWRIIITDTQNGFSNGYIKVIGSLDSSVFKFNFTIKDAVLDSRSTVWRGEYDILVNISTSKCLVSQDYIIDYIYLEDSNRLYSYFTRFQVYYNSKKNPLRNHLDNLDYYLRSSSNCSNNNNNNNNDLTPPQIISFRPSYNSSINRIISFEFIAMDLESGLMESQRPIVYIQEAATLKKLECESNIVSINNTHAEYYCELELPFGFASDFAGGALLSVYGFINNAGLFSGYSSDDRKIYDSSYIEMTYSFSNYLTGHEPYYSNSNSNLVLYGKKLSLANNISITYSDGTNKSYTPSKVIGETVIIIQRNDYKVVGPFNVTVIMNDGNKTNTLTIEPIVFRITENSTNITDIPTPTNQPQSCLGNPICGGPSKGYCSQITGCVCYSPWYGNDCLSRVIIVPKPNFNNTEPTTELPIDDEESQVFYKSLVSIVSLRELSIDNKVVHDHQLERWIYTEINSTVSQYYSSISFKSITNQTRLFEIYATLKWYHNETIIEFADQHFSMNPSSMKYAIDILDYQFESRLNRLQLVLHASLLSNKTNDICSSKEFGDTTSGDNSNYLKIKVNNTSLYGRFIKRGIIDDRIVSLSNELLDNEMNVINSPHQVQSYIGISIPWFERQSIIDPDFSILVDSSSSSSSSLTCTPNDSGLTAIQIAGIVIGCVGVAIVVIVSVIYSKYKSKQKKKFFKDVGKKLKDLN